MLKFYGNIYGQTKEDFEELKKSLEKDGFSIAYQTEVTGAVVGEVEEQSEE